LEFSAFSERRLALYLSGVAGDADSELRAADNKSLLIDSREGEASVRMRAAQIFPDQADIFYTSYFRQAQLHFAMGAPRTQFRVLAGDNTSRVARPTIIKSRRIEDRDDKGVVLPLNRRRHWSAIGEIAANDRPFAEKNDTLVWRGVTTGCFIEKAHGEPLSARYHLAQLPELAPGIDAGFTKVVQRTAADHDFPIDAVEARMGAPLSMADQLASKFVLSLEGNDVATGLKWMLGSRSTVIMPAPTCETWFCEGELRAWEHFVPVKYDLSDINDVYDWCRSNSARCAEIALNGRAYVAQFTDPKTEMALIREVVRAYPSQAEGAPKTYAQRGPRHLRHNFGLWRDYGKLKWRLHNNKRGFGKFPETEVQ
jgi:hypothetical protein